MKDLLSRSDLLATLICVIVIALGWGLLSATEEDRAERVNGPLSLKTQKVSVDTGVMPEADPVEIVAEPAPKPEKTETPEEDTEEALEEPVSVPEESYEDLPAEFPAEAPEAAEEAVEPTEAPMEEEVPAEEFEQGEEDLCPAVLEFARGQLGDAYVMGGEGPDAWDAGGLVNAAFAQVGVDLPRISSGMLEAGEPGSGAACDLAVGNGTVGIVTDSGTVIATGNASRGVVEDGYEWAGEVTYVDVLP